MKRWYPCVFLSHLPKLSHWLWFVHRRTRLFLRLLRTAYQCYHYSIARGAADSKHKQPSNIVIMNTQWLRLIQECPPWISSYQPSTLQIKLQRRGGRMEEITIGTLPAAAHQRYFARVLLQWLCRGRHVPTRQFWLHDAKITMQYRYSLGSLDWAHMLTTTTSLHDNIMLWRTQTGWVHVVWVQAVQFREDTSCTHQIMNENDVKLMCSIYAELARWSCISTFWCWPLPNIIPAENDIK